jgi:hypothetical protein
MEKRRKNKITARKTGTQQRVSKPKDGYKMEKIFDARLYVYSIGLIISSAVERIVTLVINKYWQYSPESLSYHFLSLIILIVLFILTNILLKPLTKNKFITKLALGNRYVGGRWLEIVITKDNKVSHITKLDITYDNDEINIHGECHENWRYKYDFDSVCVSMDHYEMTYVFRAKEDGNIRDDMGHLRFEAAQTEKPDKYFGHFDDKGMEFKVRAILIKNKSEIKKMKEDFIGTVSQVLLPRLIKIHGLKGLNIPKAENNE